MWADSVADVADVLGPVVGCSGPRGEFAYSYGGYAVLGQLIADLTGTSFAQAATRLVLEPLGMADSWFPAQAPVPPDAARGYRLERDGSFVPEPPPVFALQSAGGLWSTGPDLVRFGSGWRTLLPGELAEQALRPQVPQHDSAAEIGLGWLLRRPMDVAGQAGAGPGFVGLADHAPEHGPHQRRADQPAGPRRADERRADPLGRLSTARPAAGDTACAAGHCPCRAGHRAKMSARTSALDGRCDLLGGLGGREVRGVDDLGRAG